MSGGAVALEAQSHVAKYSGLDGATLQEFRMSRTVACLPQSRQAGSTSFGLIGASCLVSGKCLRLP